MPGGEAASIVLEVGPGRQYALNRRLVPADSLKAAKKLPAGFAKKGGTMFPRLTLEKAAEYAVKLAGKTHTGPEPASIVYPGVFGTTADSDTGATRASALKQFGFLQGKRDAIEATKLAKTLAATHGPERQQVLQQACVTPTLFNTLFKTYRSDRVSIARIKQKAGEEKSIPRTWTSVRVFSPSH